MEFYQFITIIGMLAGGFGWMLVKFSGIETRMSSIEQRISHLEGVFEERGRWEAKQI